MKLIYKRKNAITSVIFSCSLFCTLFISLFLSSGIAHAENSSQAEIEKPADTNKKEQSLIVNKKTAVMKGSHTKPSHIKQEHNFIPSEKIKADSSIPFPVDI